MRRILIVGVLAFAAITTTEARSGAEPRARAATIDVTGTYTSNWGPVTLRQNGKTITGSYEGGGALDGTFEGNMFRYAWHQPGAIGHGVFVVASDRELIGTWGFNADDLAGGGWRLVPATRIAIAR